MKNKEIINYVEEHSWFSLDVNEIDYLSFTTRRHGNNYREEYGEEDLEEAYKISKKLKNLYPNLSIDVDTCDEWVNIELTPNHEENNRL